MKVKIVLGFIYFFVVVSPSLASTKSETRYKDWRLTCQLVEESNNCHLFQSLTTKNNGQSILSVVVRKTVSKKMRINFTLPLGVGLVPGIVFNIDKGERYKLHYFICTNQGCTAGVVLTEQLIKELKKGTEAKVSFANLKGKVFTVPVSLMGFTKGFNALNE